MFKSLRWKLTFWFLSLSTLLILCICAIALVLVHSNLNAALVSELEALWSGIRPSLDFSTGKPSLTRWCEGARQRHFVIQPTVQLFDGTGVLVNDFGPRRIERLLKNDLFAGEVESANFKYYVFVKPIRNGAATTGYVQLQLPTGGRDAAINRFGLTMLELAPLLLLGFTATGYVVAGKAVAPIEANFQTLRQFMADAGHELKTPLAIIQANAEAMEPEIITSAPTRAKLKIVLSTTARMAAILTDMLYLARTESASLHMEKSEMRLDELARNLAADFAELFEDKQIAFDYATELQPAMVSGNAEALKRLLSNLLQNAMRYTNAGGSVKVSLVRSDRTARLAVSDTGIGIPPECLQKIFDRFFRVDESRTVSGTGLGLSIVRAIAESHNGRMEVTSQVGQGSQFTLVLPLLS